MLAVRIRSALITASALLAAGAAGAAGAAEDGSAGEGGERSEPAYELAIPADAPGYQLAALSEPLTVRAARRAQARFRGQGAGGEDEAHRYRWAGRKIRILKYKQPFELAERDMVFKFRVPGKRGTWMKLELEF